APPLSPTKAGMHGGAWRVTVSCKSAPRAHFPLSPSSGRPSASRRCPVAAGPLAAADGPRAVGDGLLPCPAPPAGAVVPPGVADGAPVGAAATAVPPVVVSAEPVDATPSWPLPLPSAGARTPDTTVCCDAGLASVSSTN